MLHSPGHTHTHTQVQENARQLGILKSLLHSIDEKNNSSFDALHGKIVVVREEAGGIRGEIAGIREDFHGMSKKLDFILQLVQDEAKRSENYQDYDEN